MQCRDEWSLLLRIWMTASEEISLMYRISDVSTYRSFLLICDCVVMNMYKKNRLKPRRVDSNKVNYTFVRRGRSL